MFLKMELCSVIGKDGRVRLQGPVVPPLPEGHGAFQWQVACDQLTVRIRDSNRQIEKPRPGPAVPGEATTGPGGAFVLRGTPHCSYHHPMRYPGPSLRRRPLSPERRRRARDGRAGQSGRPRVRFIASAEIQNQDQTRKRRGTPWQYPIENRLGTL